MLIKDFNDCQKIIEFPISEPKSKTYFTDLAHPKNDPFAIGYSLAHFMLEPGSRTVRFRFHKSSDLVLILEGSATLILEGEEFHLKELQATYIPPGKARVILNSGTVPLKFVSIAEPAFSPEDIEILETAKFEFIKK